MDSVRSGQTYSQFTAAVASQAAQYGATAVRQTVVPPQAPTTLQAYVGRPAVAYTNAAYVDLANAGYIDMGLPEFPDGTGTHVYVVAPPSVWGQLDAQENASVEAAGKAYDAEHPNPFTEVAKTLMWVGIGLAGVYLVGQFMKGRGARRAA